jgi:hypothetical protein
MENYNVIEDNVTQDNVTQENATLNIFDENSSLNGDTDSLDGGYYYDYNGYYLNREGQSNNVFIADKMITVDIIDSGDSKKKLGTKNEYVNSIPLHTNHQKLIKLAAIAYSESSFGYKIESWEEVYAIAYIHYKFPQKKAYGEGNNLYKSFITESPQNRNNKFMRHCITGAINAYLKGKDYSNDADAWDGVEQSHLTGTVCHENGFESHAATQGWTISDDFFTKWKAGILSAKDSKGNLKFTEEYIKAPQHIKAIKCYKDRKGVYYNENLYRLRSVAAYGASIFWKTLETNDEDAKHPI